MATLNYFLSAAALLCLLLCSLQQTEASCPSYSMTSTTSTQTVYFSSSYTSSKDLSCDGQSSSHTVQTISFTPPSSGYYFFRIDSVNSNGGYAALELRQGTCSGSYITCSYAASYSQLAISNYYLTYGYTYTILLSEYYTGYSLPSSNTMTVGLYSSSSGCLDNAASSTTTAQTKTVTNAYTYSTSFVCGTSGTKAAQYTSFSPPTSGNYYVRVTSSTDDIMLEIRQSGCSGTYVSCNDDLGSTTASGFNSISLSSSYNYVILVGSYSGSSSSYSHTVYIGYCGSSCSSTTTGGSTYQTQADIVYMAMLIVVLAAPLSIFFVGFLISMIFCCLSGPRTGEFNIPGYGGCCGSAMAKLRKLAITTWLFAILVWTSDWAVAWSAMSYFLSFICFIFSIIIYSSAGVGFANSSAARSSSGYKSLLIVVGVLLLINAIIAAVQAGLTIANVSQVCNSYSSYYGVYGCSYLFIIPSYGFVACFAMITLAGAAMDMGVTLDHLAVASKMNPNTGAGGGMAPQMGSGGMVISQAPMMVQQPMMAPNPGYPSNNGGGVVLQVQQQPPVAQLYVDPRSSGQVYAESPYKS